MNDINNVSWPGWEIVRKIGSGSFGSVYEIQRDVFGDIERAALKVITIPQSRSDIDELLNEGYDEASVTERFRGYLQDIAREYSMMAKMKGHTNVVYCDDIRYVQHDDGIGWDIYIKMELLTPMMSTLSNNIPEETAIRVGKDICSALVLCRQQNIVHRDIKPQNIFVSATGEYKLGDFGIAKTAEKTTGGTKIGTYKYMAPEVYNNQPYGAAADIYSLGLVMYWLLNYRRTPFLPLPPQTPSASVEEDARRRRFSGEPIPAPANGSDALKAIVLKACAYNMKDRYASPEEMLADLKALGEGKTPIAAAVMPAAAAVAAAAVPQPIGNDEGTISTFSNRGMQAEADATVGVFGSRVASMEADATVGTWNTVPKAPVNKAPEAPKAAPVVAQPAPVVAQPAPVVAQPAPVAPKAEAAAPKKEAVKEDSGEKKAKKKPWALFAGIGAAVVALAVGGVLLLSGGDKEAPATNNGGSSISQNGGNSGNSGSQNSGNSGSQNGGSNEKPGGNSKPSGGVTLSGDDVFGGERFEEMIWGYYEATNYDYNGSREDSNEFLTDMEYITIPMDDQVYEFAALPLSIQSGKASHFVGSIYYEGDFYEPYTEKGKTMFRKAYIAENGDMSEEEFQNIEEMWQLDAARLLLVDRYGGTYYVTLAYKIENGKLAFYEVSFDEKNKATLGSEPLVQLDFLHDGSKLTLAYEGVQRDYVGSGFKVDDPGLYFSGYALNEENKYEDLEGFSFYQYGRDDEPSVYVDLSNGDSPVDEVMEFDPETGSFTLSWTQRWTTYNGNLMREDDPVTISGKIVPITSYAGMDYMGFFLFVDGKRYDYLMSDKEYEEIMYGDVLDDGVSTEDLSDSQIEDIVATKNSILEDLNEAFQTAGIDASIDPASGKVTMEASFLFATNSAELSAEGAAYLNGFLDVYSAIILSDTYSGYISSIVIEGHTDTSGSYSHNQTLSEQRAASVAAHCIGRNSALASVIQTKGCSYDYPVYNEDGSVNMDKSRRVTFRFILSVD